MSVRTYRKRRMPLGRKFAIAGKHPCEKVGYVRGREIFRSASQETCTISWIYCLSEIKNRKAGFCSLAGRANGRFLRVRIYKLSELPISLGNWWFCVCVYWITAGFSSGGISGFCIFAPIFPPKIRLCRGADFRWLMLSSFGDLLLFTAPGKLRTYRARWQASAGRSHTPSPRRPAPCKG